MIHIYEKKCAMCCVQIQLALCKLVAQYAKDNTHKLHKHKRAVYKLVTQSTNSRHEKRPGPRARDGTMEGRGSEEAGGREGGISTIV